MKAVAAKRAAAAPGKNQLLVAAGEPEGQIPEGVRMPAVRLTGNKFFAFMALSVV